VLLAESLLSRHARNLLVPLWRRLSAALEAQPYRTARPELHLSYTASRAMDWGTARQAVERERDWRADPVLLTRHARACEGLRQRGTALQSWFELCWRFGGHGKALEASTDAELRRQWQDFQELDPELPVRSFPAWLLVQIPGLTRMVHEAEPGACPESYLTMERLQRARLDTEPDAAATAERAAQDQLMGWRARLKEQEPVLFQYYLDKLSTSF